MNTITTRHGARLHFEDRAAGQPIVFSHGRYRSADLVARACSRMGEDACDLLRKNCAEFYALCLSRAVRSRQVERLLSTPGAVALAVQFMAGLANAWMSARAAMPIFN